MNFKSLYELTKVNTSKGRNVKCMHIKCILFKHKDPGLIYDISVREIGDLDGQTDR